MLKDYSFSFKNLWPFFYGLLIGLYFITFTILGKNLSHFPGDLGDARLTNYLLEHSHKFITGEEKSFWNAPFMYPEEDVISYSENLVGSIPFYSVFRIAGCDRETSFQCWFIAMIVLSYFTCYLFLKWCFKNNYAAVLGAIVFAFSMALQSQMGHAQTFPRFPIPIAFWMCLLFMKELKPVYFFAALFTVVYEFYCAIYLGFFIGAVIGLLLIFICIQQRKLLLQKITNRKWLLLIAGSVIVNVLIILPLILPYLKRSKSVGFNEYAHIIESVPSLKSFFFSQHGSLFWDVFQNIAIKYPAWWDHQIFTGAIAITCVLVFSAFVITKFFKKKLAEIAFSSTTIILFVSALTTFLLFTRYQGYSLYWLIFHLPGFGSMRSLTRIINVELIYFAIATAFVFTLLNDKFKKATIPLFFLFSTLLIADNYYYEGKSYRTEKAVSQARVNKLLEQTNTIPEGAVISYEPYELPENCVFYQIDGMLTAQTKNLKTVNGYTATSPYGYSNYWNELNSKARIEWFAAKGFSIDTVYVLH